MFRRFFPIRLLLFIVLLTGCVNNPSEDTAASTSDYIENKGSDTMVNLALAWAEEYQSQSDEIRISVTGGGSGTGLAALINGTVNIANASRPIKQEEIELAQEQGNDPIEYIVARDAVAVIVNPENSIDQLTLEQISQIYKGEITNWTELGGEDRPIVRLSRETNSGTHVYFLETVIRLGNEEDESIFSANTLLLPSSEGIIAEVSSNPNAIGYDGLGYITSEVKVISVSEKGDESFVYPSIETVIDGSYPIARDLYMYTNGEPQGNLKEYLEWIYSPDAQAIVSELGFVPITTQE